ncbi:hypothetical protein NQZ68_014927 [Dissostichus eleginoides]|nr:hypothetical protein NQZ68_014927 [Dissostichus eleginoides]
MAVKAHFRGPKICFESSKRNKKDCQSNTFRDSEGNKPTISLSSFQLHVLTLEQDLMLLL